MTSLTLLRAETTIPGCSSWDRLQCAMAPWMAPSSDPALLLRFSTGVAAGGRKKNPFALPQDGVDEEDEDDEEHSGEVPGASRRGCGCTAAILDRDSMHGRAQSH